MIWSIENKQGKLIQYTNAKYPPLFETKKEAMASIKTIAKWSGGKPVEVKIIKVKK